MPRHNVLELLGEAIQTTDATVTTLSFYVTGKTKTYVIKATVVALNATDYTQGAGYTRVATFRADSAGTLTQIGSTTAPVTQEDNAAWDCAIVGGTVTADGTTKPAIILQVTGAAATLVNWRADVEILKVGIGPEYS